MSYTPGPTAQQEAAAKAATKAKRSKKYVYEPVPFDRFNPPARGLAPGATVVKIQPYGCPPNGTMGMTYVGDPETGSFIGMVCLNSLQPIARRA